MSLSIWAVEYSNYSPAEIAALYENQPAAERHAEALNDVPGETGAWRAAQWSVGSEYKPANCTRDGDE